MIYVCREILNRTNKSRIDKSIKKFINGNMCSILSVIPAYLCVRNIYYLLSTDVDSNLMATMLDLPQKQLNIFGDTYMIDL